MSKASDPAVRAGGWRIFRKRLGAALYIALCVELGIFLLVIPWSAIWSRELIPAQFPFLRPLLMNPFARGAISGLGLVNLWLGVCLAWEFGHDASR